LAEFAKDRRKGNGRRSTCKACLSEYNAEHYAENVEALRTYIAKYRAENVEAIRAQRAEYQRTPAGRAVGRAGNAKRRALKRDAFTDNHSAANLADHFEEIGAFNCTYCHAPAEHVDHIVPLARGGAHVLGNLLPACADCNLEKGARDPYEFLAERFPGLAPLFAPYVGTLPLVDSFQ
jgi:5-methylcytosine-specific restriction endonuclease McrA